MADAAVQTETLPPLREQAPQLVGERRPKSKIQRFGAWLVAPDSRAVVYLGLLLIVGGFAVVAFTWSKVAGTLSVPLQIPYIASGGFVGLGLIVVGVGVVSIAAKRRDNFARVRQLQKLSATMESIQAAIDDGASGSESDPS